ncbi:unnamed protein product [Parajaminaea phylloscopi]
MQQPATMTAGGPRRETVSLHLAKHQGDCDGIGILVVGTHLDILNKPPYPTRAIAARSISRDTSDTAAVTVASAHSTPTLAASQQTRPAPVRTPDTGYHSHRILHLVIRTHQRTVPIGSSQCA